MNKEAIIKEKVYKFAYESVKKEMGDDCYEWIIDAEMGLLFWELALKTEWSRTDLWQMANELNKRAETVK